MIKPINLADCDIDISAARKLPHEYAIRYMAIPFKKDATHLHLAFAKPWEPHVLQDLSDIVGMPVLPHLATDADIRFQIDRLLGQGLVETIATSFVDNERQNNEPDIVLPEVSDAPVVRLVDSILEAGIANRASDIHIEPYGHHLRARLRIDGLLITKFQVDISLLPNVISRLKIMAGMDIAEKRLPQDGQFTLGGTHGNLDFRLSTLPTTNGEKAVIRLLYGAGGRIDVEGLGFLEEDLPNLSKMFGSSHGSIFFTGPTGSGKSTTLAAYLSKMNLEWRNIVTVEDPVEYPILGVSHVSVSPGGKLGFKDALRHILRQDPDVILIGEVRDAETAKLAMQASITGHIVLSTIHTNDAAGVVERLIDIGIPSYMVAAALSGVISQRLVRRICLECKSPALLDTHEAKILGISIKTPVYSGDGCSLCNFTGYKGRFAIYEYFLVDEPMRNSLSANPTKFVGDIREDKGLLKNAARRVAEGSTTAGEVIKLISHGVEI